MSHSAVPAKAKRPDANVVTIQAAQGKGTTVISSTAYRRASRCLVRGIATVKRDRKDHRKPRPAKIRQH